jgi:hypothetical protein
METSEESAKRLGATLMTEVQFLQLQDREVRLDSTSVSSRAVDGMSPAEVDEYIADMKARCEGLAGVLYIGSADGVVHALHVQSLFHRR